MTSRTRTLVDSQRAALRITQGAFMRLSGLIRLGLAAALLIGAFVAGEADQIHRMGVVAAALAALGALSLLIHAVGRRNHDAQLVAGAAFLGVDTALLLAAVAWSGMPQLAFVGFFPLALEVSMVTRPGWTVAYCAMVGVGTFGLGWDAGQPSEAGIAAASLGPLLVLFGLTFSHLLSNELRGRQEDGARLAEMERHVTALSAAFDAIARGDLRPQDEPPATNSLDGATAASMSSLHESLDAMRRALSSLVGGVQNTGEDLATAADGLQGTAQREAEASHSQAAAVTQTNATVRELAATAATIAQSAESVAGYAESTSQVSVSGREAVLDSIDGLERISDRVEAIAARTNRLGEVSDEIGMILDLIEDLSDETGLLALNAAIEAARAGEQGRGFAVVAEEIRKLADRSMTATRDIQNLVGEIREETHASIVATHSGTIEVESGRLAVQQVGAVLEQITEMAFQAARAAGEISSATAQQRSSSNQVADAMASVAETSSAYADTSRDTANAAAHLNVLAGSLRGTLGKFRT